MMNDCAGEELLNICLYNTILRAVRKCSRDVFLHTNYRIEARGIHVNIRSLYGQHTKTFKNKQYNKTIEEGRK